MLLVDMHNDYVVCFKTGTGASTPWYAAGVGEGPEKWKLFERSTVPGLDNVVSEHDSLFSANVAANCLHLQSD